MTSAFIAISFLKQYSLAVEINGKDDEDKDES